MGVCGACRGPNERRAVGGHVAADASWRFVPRQSPILADEPAPVGQGRALPDQDADRVEAADVEGGAQARHLFGINPELSLGADKVSRAPLPLKHQVFLL
jgi:hypothetical protein